MARLEKTLSRGRPKVTHGGYSFLTTGQLPERRVYILRYLSAARQGLIEDLGGEEKNLTTAQLILIDRIISKLGIIRCIEEHIKETSILDGSDLAPALRSSYIAYNNSIRLTLQLLGIDKRMTDRPIDPIEFVKKFDEEEEKEKKKAEDLEKGKGKKAS